MPAAYNSATRSPSPDSDDTGSVDDSLSTDSGNTLVYTSSSSASSSPDQKPTPSSPGQLSVDFCLDKSNPITPSSTPQPMTSNTKEVRAPTIPKPFAPAQLSIPSLPIPKLLPTPAHTKQVAAMFACAPHKYRAERIKSAQRELKVPDVLEGPPLPDGVLNMQAILPAFVPSWTREQVWMSQIAQHTTEKLASMNDEQFQGAFCDTMDARDVLMLRMAVVEGEIGKRIKQLYVLLQDMIDDQRAYKSTQQSAVCFAEAQKYHASIDLYALEFGRDVAERPWLYEYHSQDLSRHFEETLTERAIAAHFLKKPSNIWSFLNNNNAYISV